jgi:MerR family copper efflux transcriptional regulator
MRTKEHLSSWTRTAVAKRAGSGPETLRFYEQKGLLGTPRRNAVGYRLYGAGDVERLAFIRRAQELGFSLQDIKQLLALTSNIRTPRKKVRDFAEARLTLIRQKIRDLKAMEKALSGLVTRCDGRGELKGCPIAEFVGGGCEESNGGNCHE